MLVMHRYSLYARKPPSKAESPPVAGGSRLIDAWVHAHVAGCPRLVDARIADGSYLSRRAAITGWRRGRHRCAAIARRSWLVDAGIHATAIPGSTRLIHASIAALSDDWRGPRPRMRSPPRATPLSSPSRLHTFRRGHLCSSIESIEVTSCSNATCRGASPGWKVNTSSAIGGARSQLVKSMRALGAPGTCL